MSAFHSLSKQRQLPRGLDYGLVAAAGQRVHEALVLVASRAVQPGGKDGDDLQHVLGQLFLEARLFALVDYHDFDSLQLAQHSENNKFSAEPQQAVLVRYHQARRAPVKNQIQ